MDPEGSRKPRCLVACASNALRPWHGESPHPSQNPNRYMTVICHFSGGLRLERLTDPRGQMGSHRFRPSVERLDDRVNPGTSWGPAWVFKLAAFLLSHHLLKAPRVKVSPIVAPQPVNLLPTATVVSVGAGPTGMIQATSTIQATPVGTAQTPTGIPVTVHPVPLHLAHHHLHAHVHSPHRR
jgi:hypothetical protein